MICDVIYAQLIALRMHWFTSHNDIITFLYISTKWMYKLHISLW